MEKNNPAALVATGLAALLLAACSGGEAPPAAAAPASSADTGPLETRERNGIDYQPAFAGQTRAPGIRNGDAVQVQVLASGLTQPFAVEPLPDGRFLVSEKPGRLRIIGMDGTVSAPVEGLPAIHYKGQAGLLDVALDPQFASNHVIYFCYTELRGGTTGGNTLARARLLEEGGTARLVDVKPIFHQLPDFASDRQLGSRIVFGKDGKLFVTMGERGEEGAVGQAQDLHSHFGKVVRLNSDGSVPKDNPFVGRADAYPEIWSWGHRNAQAADVDAQTGDLWVIEHGPRGGDELNLIKRGANYGWPVITYGIDYPGNKVGAGITSKEGMEQPVYYWDPVIAPSGMFVYHGDMFPEWKGSIFVGGLVGMKLVRLQMKDGKVAGEEWLLQDRRKRIRDVQQGPDGAIYVLTDAGEKSELLRIFRSKPA
jgi:glucose/arabinose dehydrogenase